MKIFTLYVHSHRSTYYSLKLAHFQVSEDGAKTFGTATQVCVYYVYSNHRLLIFIDKVNNQVCCLKLCPL